MRHEGSPRTDSASLGTERAVAQSPSTTGQEAAGAVSEPAEAERSYSQTDLQAILTRKTASASIEGAKKGRAELLSTLQVQSEDELTQLLELGRKAVPTQQSEGDKALAQLKAKHETEIAKERAETARLKALAERAHIVSEARKHLEDVRDPDLVLAKFGISPEPEYRLAVQDGKVVVLDADGDVHSADLGKFLKAQKAKSENVHWLKSIGGGSGGKLGGPSRPSVSNGNGASDDDSPRSFAEAVKRARQQQ